MMQGMKFENVKAGDTLYGEFGEPYRVLTVDEATRLIYSEDSDGNGGWRKAWQFDATPTTRPADGVRVP